MDKTPQDLTLEASSKEDSSDNTVLDSEEDRPTKKARMTTSISTSGSSGRFPNPPDDAQEIHKFNNSIKSFQMCTQVMMRSLRWNLSKEWIQAHHDYQKQSDVHEEVLKKCIARMHEGPQKAYMKNKLIEWQIQTEVTLQTMCIEKGNTISNTFKVDVELPKFMCPEEVEHAESLR